MTSWQLLWWLLYQRIIKTALLDFFLCPGPGQLLQTVSSSFHPGLLIRQPLFYDFTVADPWLFAQPNILAELQTWLPASHLLSSAAHWQKDNGFQFSMDQSHVTGMSSLWSFWLLACCKILLCDYDHFIVIVVEGFRSFRALLCEWDLFKWLKIVSFFRTFRF